MLHHLRKQESSRKGFTLIELLVVIAIIGILATVVFVALDPVTRFQQARDSRRWNDVNSILTALHQYAIDNDGAFPSGVPSDGTAVQLGTAATGCDSPCTAAQAACVDLSTDLASYFASIPVDPNGSTDITGYQIANNGGIITVTACNAENTTTIEVSR